MMNKDKILQFILKNSSMKKIYYCLKKNRIDSRILIESTGRLVRCIISQEKGCFGNRVIIGANTNLIKSIIEFHGNNNCIYIGEQGQITGNKILVYDDNNTLRIGEHFNSDHDTTIAVLEGKTIEIGDDCLFSYNIEIRNSDSHSLLDENGLRTNPASDVVIGNHVWIAQRSIILKGARIHSGCVVAANTLVTGHSFRESSLIVGSPARITRSNISWDINRI